MTPIELHDIPLWPHATGRLKIDVNIPSPAAPLPVSADAIESATFHASGKTTLGPAASVSLGLNAHHAVKLAALFKEQTGAAPELVSEFQLAEGLTDTNVLLAIEIGGNASLSSAGSYAYNVLKAGASLEAGRDGRLVHIRAFVDRTKPAQELLDAFIGTLTVPAAIEAPPAPGQVTTLEFGGFLKFAASAAAGYEIKGTHSLDIGKLGLSEHYELSVAGRLAISASLAGRFAVEARRADDHWARVTVRRKRSTDLQIGADLTVGAELDTQGLPASGKEFLEALIGVRAKNWLNLAANLIDQAAGIKSARDLADKLDGLARDYVGKLAGKAVSELLPPEVESLMGKLRSAVASYNALGSDAVSVFERFLHLGGDGLKNVLEKTLKGITDWSRLQGEIDPVAWNIVQQLTGGRPLDFMLGGAGSLKAFQKGVAAVLALIDDPGHQALRDCISVAEKEFGLDRLLAAIEKVDTPENLATALSDVAKHQVERLIGVAIDRRLKGKNLQRVFDLLQEIKRQKDVFFARFDAVLKEAARQSYHLDFNAAYTRSSGREALIEVEIRLLNDDGSPCESGRKLMRSAGIGDFADILGSYNPAVVRLRSGLLTHNLSTSGGIKINIAGWHREFQYQDMSKVVTRSGQQIRPTSAGMINVFTTVDMSVERDRTRKTSKAEQSMHSNFTLRYLAETRGVVDGSRFDPRTRAYLLDVITGQSAVYMRLLKESQTTQEKLDGILAFARTLGLDQAGATREALAPLLKQEAGAFGPSEAEYSVRFTEAGLTKLFQTAVSKPAIRQVIRAIVLANYIGDAGLEPVAWMCSSDKVAELAMGNPNFVAAGSILKEAIDSGEARAVSPIPGILAPPLRPGNPAVRQFASTLIHIEETLVRAFQKVRDVLSGGQIALADLEKALDGFGKALDSFDRQATLSAASPSAAFAVFDRLIALASPGARDRDSTLSLAVGAGPDQHRFLFQLAAGPNVAAAGAD